MNYMLNSTPQKCSVVPNKQPKGVQMYTKLQMGSSDNFLVHIVGPVVQIGNEFHTSIHSILLAFMATVANGAVRLSIDLQLISLSL